MEISSSATIELLLKSKREKKNNAPSISDCERFKESWLHLVINEGLSEQAERFLYEGFVFCGAEPLMLYLTSADDQNEVVRAFFKGKMYKKDASVTFRLLSHLLALALNNREDQKLLAQIIIRLPNACRNKDGKRLGNAEKTMEKYFFAKLKPDIELFPLEQIDITPSSIRDFMELIESVIVGIQAGTIKKEISDSISKTQDWFKEYRNKNINENDILPDEVKNKLISQDNAQIVRIFPEKEPNNSISDILNQQNADKCSLLTELFNEASKIVYAIKTENIQQKNKESELFLSLQKEQIKLCEANQQLSENQKIIALLHGELTDKNNEILSLRNLIEQKNSLLTAKDLEITERIKMTDVLSRDRSKQVDEVLHRLASEIRIEYQDFMDAKNIPMSCDLGENLRLQLQSIFDLLERNGMKIK